MKNTFLHIPFIILCMLFCNQIAIGQPENGSKKVLHPAELSMKLTVKEKNDAPLEAIGAELDPHFLSQNVVRNDGSKAEDWDNIVVRRVREMGLQRLRIMILPQWYEPVNDNDDPYITDWSKFTFDSPEMKSLYKVLDMAQQSGMETTLVLWGAHIGHFLAGENSGNWVVAPASNEEWAENFSALVQYLIKEKGYSCITEITPVNEPDWSFLIGGKMVSADIYAEMCKALDKRFRDDGIRHCVRFSLSDNSDGGSGTHDYLAACCRELKDVADVFNSHTYIFGYETPNSVIFNWEKENSRLAEAVGKPHFIGEFGGNQCVGSSRQKDINLYERGVLMVRIAINALNAGACGISYWGLIDQYYGKNQAYADMQQLGLWKYLKSTYANDSTYQDIEITGDYEPRPQYYAYSLVSRFLRPGAEIHPVSTDNEFVAATAVKNRDGKWVYLFANATDSTIRTELKNDYCSRLRSKYDVYIYERAALPASDDMIKPTELIKTKNKAFSYNLPANSVVLFKEK